MIYHQITLNGLDLISEDYFSTLSGLHDLEKDIVTNDVLGDGEAWGRSKTKPKTLTLNIAVMRLTGEAFTALNQAIAPNGLKRLELDTAEYGKIFVMVEIQNRMTGDSVRLISLQLTMPDPHLYSVDTSTVSLGASYSSGVVFGASAGVTFSAQTVKTGNSVDLTDAANVMSLTVSGNTTQDGTGDASPDNVRPIHGVTKVTVDGVDYALSRELFDSDYCDVISEKGTAQKKKAVLDGSSDELMGLYKEAETSTHVAFYSYGIMTDRNGTSADMICSRFSWNLSTLSPSYSGESFVMNEHGTAPDFFYFKILKSRLTGWDDSLTGAQKVALARTWLSANPAAVLYKLATPQTITGAAITADFAGKTVSADNGGQLSAIYMSSAAVPGKDIVFGTSIGAAGTVINSGNTDAYPVITVVGTCSSIGIRNITTGEEIDINVQLMDSDTLKIDCRPKTCGVWLNEARNIALKATAGWIHCPPGENKFSFSRNSLQDKKHCTVELQSRWL